MADIEFSARARADFRAIFFHSIRTFGLDVANAYVAEIDAKLARLGEWPLLGEPVAGRLPPVRHIGTTSHVIYYRPKPPGIYVVRILHARMDERQRL